MRNNKNLKIKTFTWSKDSHGLFDYESSHIALNKTLCCKDILIARNNKEVIFLNPDLESLPIECTPLCTIKRTQDGRFLMNSEESNSPIKLVIRSLKSNGKQKGFELKAGDRIKTGRVEYYVREIKTEEEEIIKADDGTLCLDSEEAMDIEADDKEKRHCRICFSEENYEAKSSPNYKFITPCKCKGSSQYIHMSCLQEWLESKKQIKKAPSNIANNQAIVNPMSADPQANSVTTSNTNTIEQPHEGLFDTSNQNLQSNNQPTEEVTPTPPSNPVVNYQFSNFCCDVCRENLPFRVKISKNSEYETVKILRPETGSYMLLEKISHGKEVKTISVIKGSQDQEVKMGRGHLSDIIIADISVSRLHSSIKYQDGKFYLFDMNSKFGTLAQLQEPVEILKDKIGIQCGRTLITVVLREEKGKGEEATSAVRLPNLIEQTPVPYPKKTVSTKKRTPSHIRISTQKDTKDGGSEGTLDVEEVVPSIGNELQIRSKKINKGGKRGSNK